MEPKTLRLLRHGEAFHNVEGEILLQIGSAWKVLFDGRWRRLRISHIVRALRCVWNLMFCSLLLQSSKVTTSSNKPTTSYYEHTDASLTSTGWQQAEQLGKELESSGVRDRVSLVVVSPLTRTLQTAAGVFGGGNHSDVSQLLMVHFAGRCPHPAISSSGSPPFVAVELCREEMSVMPCDHRSSRSKNELQFPGIDFSEIEQDQDELWRPDVKETEEELGRRTRAFLEWLSNRKEKDIAVVSHGGFLVNLLTKFGDKNVNTTRYANCELRSVEFRKVLTQSGSGYTFELSPA
ncbi:phosphoglycerate mutase-like protein [Selaginella moellendorffii]|uniref:phosphoglycerate mutase-like protein n=1 Tax=Selaginella moellendorffii TaxID=88036 RepID=UPI000D1C480F|nr:phosphoglycerate mutase-like protein [Selaginella moellendorffii]|eukprot:XP_024528447.1 phosphoglycerate mutase-like protein [Selaginella moellendorffii]